MDQSKIDVSSQSQSEQLDQNLSELRKDVQLSPTKLRQITNTNQFVQRVIQLNNNAKQSIEIGRPKEALIYLAQAQRILQHAANYGKPIQKNLIIHILHNEACCHQKKWEMQKCSGYLQALIYNYNTYLKNNEGIYPEHNAIENRKSKELITIENIEKKNQLAKYYLQFQVVNSQENNHSGALIAGRKAIEIIKSNFREIYVVSKRLKKSPYQKKFDIQLRTKIIDCLSRLNDNFSFSDSKSLLNAALYFLKCWNQSSSSKDKQKDRNYVLQEQFKHFSIGNPLNLVPIMYHQSRQQRQKNFSAKNILEKLLTLTVCYFTIATQLRYISDEKNKNNQSAKKNSAQFKESELYHLLSICLISYFIPFDILLMKHITNSFQTHYGINLFQMINKIPKNQLQNYGYQRQCQKYEGFLFPESNRISEASSSILISGIGENLSNYENDKIQVNTTSQKNGGANSGNGTSRTIKKNQRTADDSQTTQNKDMQFTMNQMTSNARKLYSSPGTYNKIVTEPNSSKKIKPTPSKKSKSKSKNKLGMSSFNIKKEEQLLDRSPMPKSPKIHGISNNLRDSRGIVKIKTTHRLKISTQKIEYRKQGQNQRKSPVMNFDYFTSKSKDLKKSNNVKKPDVMKTPHIMQSPKAHNINTSRSSSRRQSPVPNYFQPMKSGRKTIKSPRPDTQQNPYTSVKPKTKKKSQKMSFQQYYL